MISNIYHPIADLALRDCHHDTVDISYREDDVTSVERGCIDLSPFRNPSSRRYYQVMKAELDEGDVLHINDSSSPSQCQCLNSEVPKLPLTLPVHNDEILVFRHFNMADLYHCVISVSKETAKEKTYNVLVDFSEGLHPRLLPLTALSKILLEPILVAENVQKHGLGLYSKRPRDDQARDLLEEFAFFCTEESTLNIFKTEEEWSAVAAKSVEDSHTFYKSKEDPINLRRIIIHRRGRWFCLIQFKPTSVILGLTTDFSGVERDVKPRFKRELLLVPSTCDQLLASAKEQKKILNKRAALTLEADVLAEDRKDRLFIVEGARSGPSLDDNERWLNNYSKGLRDSYITDGSPPPRLTTFIPRYIRPEPQLTKEHLIYKGHTFLFYHHVQKRKKGGPVGIAVSGLHPASAEAKKKKISSSSSSSSSNSSSSNGSNSGSGNRSSEPEVVPEEIIVEVDVNLEAYQQDDDDDNEEIEVIELE